jgi:hypothetical protein
MSVGKRDLLMITIATLVVGTAWLILIRGHASSGRWPGMDEAVIGRFVNPSGSSSAPLFDWLQGDMLLFAFLVAGLLAGFVLGFFARSTLGREERAP